ncbi:hypothetical protein ACFV2B_09445 [Streptomyces lavendulae]|uniref:hypothetical protein n=1 Tax=Streptomyces lavendulae TaxID=1914 RepID=UPI0036C18D8A
MDDDRPEEPDLERGHAVKESTVKRRERARRLVVLKTAGGWVLSGLVRELVRRGLSMWWGP